MSATLRTSTPSSVSLKWEKSGDLAPASTLFSTVDTDRYCAWTCALTKPHNTVRRRKRASEEWRSLTCKGSREQHLSLLQ